MIMPAVIAAMRSKVTKAAIKATPRWRCLPFALRFWLDRFICASLSQLQLMACPVGAIEQLFSETSLSKLALMGWPIFVSNA
jgi:hypothetical protein